MTIQDVHRVEVLGRAKNVLDSARNEAVGVSGECALFPGTGVTAPLNPGPYLTLCEIGIQSILTKLILLSFDMKNWSLCMMWFYVAVFCQSV